MSSFRFTGAEILDSELAEPISRLLDEAQVPKIIWNEYILNILGVPTVVNNTEFVVPDELLETAYQALLAAGFPPCTKGADCQLLCNTFRMKPAPPAHLYIVQHDDKDRTHCLMLYRKSDVLWDFPEFPLSTPAPNDPYYTVATDPQLPAPFSESHYPLKMVKPTKVFEAVVLLYCRDNVFDEYGNGENSDDEGSDYCGLWITYLSYLFLYVKPAGVLNPDGLRPHFLPIWDEKTRRNPNPDEGGKPLFSKLRDLRASLLAENALPPRPRARPPQATSNIQ